MSDLTYYQKNRGMMLNRAKYYYKNDKEEKNQKRKYGKNKYRNMSEESKQRLKEYQKNYREVKVLNIIMNKIVFKFFFNSVCCDFKIQ